MARHCLALATGLIQEDALRRALDVPGIPPNRALVVAARGVFTAPLEWVVLLAATGASVTLKAPAEAPSFAHAIASAFGAEGLEVRVVLTHDLPAADAIVAMGSDATMARIAARHPHARLSLHGHRSSVAVVDSGSPDLGRALALDVARYDGRGCFTPTAVFVLGDDADADAAAAQIAAALAALEREIPPAPRPSLLGPEWRQRSALGRMRGRLLGGEAWAVARVPATHAWPAALPWFIGVHPVQSREAVLRHLAPWGGHIAGCATNVRDLGPLSAHRIERFCLPGHLQAPPLGRPHGGQEALRPLFFQQSIERAAPSSP